MNQSAVSKGPMTAAFSIVLPKVSRLQPDTKPGSHYFTTFIISRAIYAPATVVCGSKLAIFLGRALPPSLCQTSLVFEKKLSFGFHLQRSIRSFA